VDRTFVTPRKRKPLESRVRRGVELFLLTVSLFVGLAIVGGCGGCGFVVYSRKDAVASLISAIFLATLLVAVVYLSTSMSRDARILKEQQLERQDHGGSSERGRAGTSGG
jgi:hypothetical protein